MFNVMLKVIGKALNTKIGKKVFGNIYMIITLLS